MELLRVVIKKIGEYFKVVLYELSIKLTPSLNWLPSRLYNKDVDSVNSVGLIWFGLDGVLYLHEDRVALWRKVRDKELRILPPYLAQEFLHLNWFLSVPSSQY